MLCRDIRLSNRCTCIHSNVLPPSLSHRGYVLITTLIILFVLTLLVIGSSEFGIVNQKMQNHWEQYNQVFERAEEGLMQMVGHFEGESIALSDSPIMLTTSYTVVYIDHCQNQTIDFQSTAKNAFSTVILNSRDIFARVPSLKGCNSIPKHQVIWWRE